MAPINSTTRLGPHIRSPDTGVSYPQILMSRMPLRYHSLAQQVFPTTTGRTTHKDRTQLDTSHRYEHASGHTQIQHNFVLIDWPRTPTEQQRIDIITSVFGQTVNFRSNRNMSRRYRKTWMCIGDLVTLRSLYTLSRANQDIPTQIQDRMANHSAKRRTRY